MHDRTDLRQDQTAVVEKFEGDFYLQVSRSMQKTVLQDEKQTSELAAKAYLQGMSVVCSCPISGVSRVKAPNQFALPVLYLPTWCWPSTGPSLSLDQLTERWKRSFMRVEANTHSARRLNCTCQETSMVCTTSDIQISSTPQGFFQGQIIVFND